MWLAARAGGVAVARSADRAVRLVLRASTANLLWQIGYRLNAGETVIALLETNRHVAEHVVTEKDIAALVQLYRTQRLVKER